MHPYIEEIYEEWQSHIDAHDYQEEYQLTLDRVNLTEEDVVAALEDAFEEGESWVDTFIDILHTANAPLDWDNILIMFAEEFTCPCGSGDLYGYCDCEELEDEGK